MGTLVLSHIPSLRAIRAARRTRDRLPWDAVGRVEQRRAVARCVPNGDQIDLDDLVRLGAWEATEGEPLHLLVGEASARRDREPIACHVVSAALPAGALMRVVPGVYAEAPAFMALQYSRGRTLGEVAALLMELLGTYSLPEEAASSISWGGVWPDSRARRDVEQAHYRCEPAVTMAELKAMVRWAKSSDFATFRSAVRIVAPGSASPAETVMFGMLGAPMRFGGFACAGLPKGGMRLNHRLDFDANAVRMASGVPYAICDAYIPAAKIDLEYNGAGHEVENARIHDGQRNNGLKGMGVTVLVINRDQMRDVSALEAMARSIYKAAGRQFRYTFKGYRLRQEGLLSDLRKGIGLPGA